MPTLDHTRLSLRQPKALRVPPRAETIARMPDVAAKVQQMKASVFILEDGKSAARIAALESQLALANQLAEAAKQQLHAQASQAWLEAEARLQKQAMERRVQRQHHLEYSRVTDHTLPDLAPQCVITTDAVKPKLALNPRTAVPMDLPLFSRIKRCLMRKP